MEVLSLLIVLIELSAVLFLWNLWAGKKTGMKINYKYLFKFILAVYLAIISSYYIIKFHNYILN